MFIFVVNPRDRNDLGEKIEHKIYVNEIIRILYTLLSFLPELLMVYIQCDIELIFFLISSVQLIIILQTLLIIKHIYIYIFKFSFP